MKRVSLGRRNGSPKAVVKAAVAQSLDVDDSRFYFISATLKHCGYVPRFGFVIKPGRNFDAYLEELLYRERRGSPEEISRRDEFVELEQAINYIRRIDLYEPFWIDARRSRYEFSIAREFATVLRCERRLKSLGFLTGIEVYLERSFDGEVIEIRHASSGQLSLISTLLFVITFAGDEPVIILDEPENSLHPSWQRDYVAKLMDALNYRNASVFIATHAPLVVTGALANSADLVGLYEIREGVPRRLDIDASETSTSSIEEILWRAFEVVTPANHFVSEQIVAAMTDFEEGRISKVDLLEVIDDMDKHSFDGRQRRFFQAVRSLADEVEDVRGGVGETDD